MGFISNGIMRRNYVSSADMVQAITLSRLPAAKNLFIRVT